MARALVLLAEGFEEIEAVTIIDVLRRAQVDVTACALGTKHVTGSHGICVEADAVLDEIAARRGSGNVGFDAVVLPGGMPGSRNLREDARVRTLVANQAEAGRVVAAICAAPIVLEAAGVLHGRAATCYPGYELPSATPSDERVVVDGHVVTSRGPGTAIEFSLRLVEMLVGSEAASKLRHGMIVAPN